MAHIGLVTVVVSDYDEAIAYYMRVLGFQLMEDTQLGRGKRWVVMSPAAGEGAALLLARAANDARRSRVGNQTGGRVFLFLYTDDFARDFQRLKSAGVTFSEEPRHETYGTVAVFTDRFGNRWDLVQPSRASPGS